MLNLYNGSSVDEDKNGARCAIDLGEKLCACREFLSNRTLGWSCVSGETLLVHIKGQRLQRHDAWCVLVFVVIKAIVLAGIDNTSEDVIDERVYNMPVLKERQVGDTIVRRNTRYSLTIRHVPKRSHALYSLWK